MAWWEAGVDILHVQGDDEADTCLLYDMEENNMEVSCGDVLVQGGWGDMEDGAVLGDNQEACDSLGCYLDEIVSLVTLPKYLHEHPFLEQVYGTVEWSVKAIHAQYVGWFSGDPADLCPMSKKVCWVSGVLDYYTLTVK